MRVRSLLATATVMVIAGAGRADFVTIGAARDNTLYQDPLGQTSNGAGSHFFTGRNSEGTRRRGLLAFDVEGAVPAGSIIDRVALTLHLSRSSTGPSDVSLYRALAAWGEGASDAPGSEGQGAPAEPGDATWLHTFYDQDFWATPGGDFANDASGVALIDQPGFYTWESTDAMVADVQDWLDDSEDSFGWMLLGDERDLSTAKRFDTRENEIADFRPSLTIEFTVPGPGVLAPMLAGGGLLMRRRRRTSFP